MFDLYLGCYANDHGYFQAYESKDPCNVFLLCLILKLSSEYPWSHNNRQQMSVYLCSFDYVAHGLLSVIPQSLYGNSSVPPRILGA